MNNEQKRFDILYEQICTEGGLWDRIKGIGSNINDALRGPTSSTKPFLNMFATFTKNVRSHIKTYKEQCGKIHGVLPAEKNSPALNARKRIEKLDQFLHNLSADPMGHKGRFVCDSNKSQSQEYKKRKENGGDEFLNSNKKERLSTGLIPNQTNKELGSSVEPNSSQL